MIAEALSSVMIRRRLLLAPFLMLTIACVTASSPSSAAQTARPDLEPGLLMEIPAVVDLGEQFPAAVVAKNWGSRSARASTVGWYMVPMKYSESLEPHPNRHDIRVATSSLSALPAGGVDWPSAMIMVPTRLKRGAFYGFMVCLDVNHSVTERSHSDNCTSTAFPSWIAPQPIK